MRPTLSFRKPRLDVRCRLLPPRWLVKDQADACLSAALAFVWCARVSWGKRELARWLVGPYAKTIEATREPSRPCSTPQRSIPETTIRQLLERSHAKVIRLLRTCSSWKTDHGFARLMVDGGLVVGVIDEESAIGFAPAARDDMRLVDRVTSLFVADFLTRPAQYERLWICEACAAVTFDGGREHVQVCTGTRPAVTAPSARRRRRITLVGLGGRAA